MNMYLDMLKDTLLDLGENQENFDPTDLYQLKGNKVILTSKSRTLKVPYDNFFKVSFKKRSGGRVGHDIKFFDSEGVDILAFLIFGMVSILSNTPRKEDGGIVDIENGSKLDELSKYIMRNYPLVTSLDAYKDIIHNINTYTALQRYNIDDIDTLMESKYPSFFLGILFGSTNLRNEMLHKKEIASRLFALAVTEYGAKALTDIFCHFSVTILGKSLGYYPDLISLDLQSVLPDMIRALDKDRVGDYKKFRFNSGLTISDVEGVSVLLCTRFADYITGSDLMTSDFDFRVHLREVLGNDYIKSYLFDGGLKKFLKSCISNKAYTFNPPINNSNKILSKSLEIEGSAFAISTYVIWRVSEVCKDIVKHNLSPTLSNLMDSLPTNIFSKKEACSLLAIEFSHTSDLLTDIEIEKADEVRDKYRNQIDNQANLIAKYEESIKAKDKEIEELKSSLEESSFRSDSISTEEYNRLKSSLGYKDLKIEELEDKLQSYKKRVSEIEGSMEDLLSSLNEDDNNEDTGVSNKDMIEFLNGFNILFIGGRTDMVPKLQDMGWYNVTQVSNVTELGRSNLNSYDFIVTMTRFISHALFHSTINRGIDRDRNMYFNNTNLNQLLNSCYDFVYSYLSK